MCRRMVSGMRGGKASDLETTTPCLTSEAEDLVGLLLRFLKAGAYNNL